MDRVTVAAAGLDADTDVDVDGTEAGGIAVEADGIVDRKIAGEADCDTEADAVADDAAAAAVEADRVKVELEVPSRVSAYWMYEVSSAKVATVLIIERDDTAPHFHSSGAVEDRYQAAPMV